MSKKENERRVKQINKMSEMATAKMAETEAKLKEVLESAPPGISGQDFYEAITSASFGGTVFGRTSDSTSNVDVTTISDRNERTVPDRNERTVPDRNERTVVDDGSPWGVSLADDLNFGFDDEDELVEEYTMPPEDNEGECQRTPRAYVTTSSSNPYGKSKYGGGGKITSKPTAYKTVCWMCEGELPRGSAPHSLCDDCYNKAEVKVKGA